jgi:hypothetical protein
MRILDAEGSLASFYRTRRPSILLMNRPAPEKCLFQQLSCGGLHIPVRMSAYPVGSVKVVVSNLL